MIRSCGQDANQPVPPGGFLHSRTGSVTIPSDGIPLQKTSTCGSSSAQSQLSCQRLLVASAIVVVLIDPIWLRPAAALQLQNPSHASRFAKVASNLTSAHGVPIMLPFVSLPVPCFQVLETWFPQLVCQNVDEKERCRYCLCTFAVFLPCLSLGLMS